MTTSVRYRTLVRAAREWEAGRPHQALMILDEAGMRALWPQFVRVATAHARKRFTRAITRRR